MVSLSLFPRLLAAQGLDLKSLAGEDWYGLYMNGHKSGYAMQRLTVQDDNSATFEEDAHFRIMMVNAKQDMRIRSRRVYGADGGLVSVESRVEDQNAGTSTWSARVEGDSLVLTTVLGGSTMNQTLPKPDESVEDALRHISLIAEGGKVGNEAAYTVFEPMLMKEIHATSRIVGVEQRVLDGAPTKVFRIKTHMQELDLTSISYITEDGTTLEDVTAGTITMRLEPKEVAQDVDYENDVIVSNAAVVDAPIGNPRLRPSLELRITGPLTPGHLFNDERQFLASEGDAFRFIGKRISLDEFEPAHLPITDKSVAEWLNASQFVQSDHPRLVEKAREIVGDETDASKVSEKLCHWVFANVNTTYSARISNSLEVLESLAGDCTEHSILFVGLARAAGLPAREVAGLIYWQQGDYCAFLFHQWAKVWVGKWIDVDPTFDQPLADATHIKLAEGDLFKQTHLIPIIGQIRIEVVENSEGS
jgi:transglutaminase-like putative cysteine protease